MLISQLAPTVGFPHIQSFLVQTLDLQFSDVRAMLQLPRPDVGITPGCNFAIVSSLCNLVSGISTTIYKPPHLLHEMQSEYKSGAAFRGLIDDYFGYVPSGVPDFSGQLYKLCRNPMAHSVGVQNAPAPVVYFTRVFDPAHPDIGWSDGELEGLERPDRPQFDLVHPSIVIDPPSWTLHCDSFYLEVIDMLRRLNSDSAQMTAAENRFSNGIYNWRQ